MSELPPALRPWAAELAAFVPELALALGPTLRGLAAALGPMGPQPEAQRDAPDGFSGLARRGSYERLLLSEWALADELPDEFVRRAAGGEHLFLQLDRPAPRKGRRCVVGFDAGPDQVGGPRIVHLALLVVLARRAAQAGATLEWCHLQEDTLRQGADRAALQALLAGRSARDPAVADRLAGPPAAGDELWLVGGARTPHLPGAARVVLAEPLDRPDEIDVTLVRAGATRELVLPLPAPHLRTRLLRSPLAQVTPAYAYPRPEDPDLLRFSPNGHWLVRPEPVGWFVARPLGQGKPRRFGYAPHHWRPVAFGFGRRSAMLGLFRHVSDDRYAFLASGVTRREVDADALDYGDDELLEVVRAGPRGPTWFRDRAGTVWELDRGAAPRAVGTAGILLAETVAGPLWVSSEAGHPTVVHAARYATPVEVGRFDLRGETAFVGPAMPGRPHGDARHQETLRILVAGEGRFQLWTALGAPRTREARPLPGDVRVRGLTFTPELGEALVLTEPDGTDLRLWAPDGRGARVAKGPVRTAIASQGRVARVAWSLEDGSVWVCEAADTRAVEIVPPRSGP